MITDELSVDKFNALNFDEKAWHVWHHANFLMIRQNSYYRVNLYYLNGYYIQLWYHIKRNRIAKIAATRSERIVDAYLPSISIENLILN